MDVNAHSLRTFITNSARQNLHKQKDDWRAVLKNLPRVDKETADQIMRSVEESDAIDLDFQRQALETEK